MLLGVVGAVAAYGLAVYASGVAVLARLHGEVWVYAGWDYVGEPGGSQTIDPADGPSFFATAALAEAIATLGLAVTWLGQRRVPRPDAASPSSGALSAVVR